MSIFSKYTGHRAVPCEDDMDCYLPSLYASKFQYAATSPADKAKRCCMKVGLVKSPTQSYGAS